MCIYIIRVVYMYIYVYKYIKKVKSQDSSPLPSTQAASIYPGGAPQSF